MTSSGTTEIVHEQPVSFEANADFQHVPASTVTYKLRATANWVKKSYKKRNFWERIATLELASDKCYVVQPQNPNPPPNHSGWSERLWLAVMIAPALIIQALWYYIIPETSFFHTWHPIVAFIFYHLAFVVFTLRLIKHLTYYMDLYGTFDEHNRPRDYVADKDVTRLLLSVLVYTIARTGGGLILGGYNRYAPPSLGDTISWAFPIKIGLWLIALDFFFYSYHRSVHTFPFLWKYHSKHHATKHPTPMQAILADDVQEIIEIFLIPLAASLVMPLSAHEFWIAQCILMYIEGMGHSGVRAYWTHPLLGEVLRPFGMELTIEDHDLHHRYGKSGKNYGKQTRIFDRIFNTISERVEGTNN
jgi:sterol desaturase/sphingolipid hydroxylase (fatty acid hydroxylase superfamily)